MTLKKHINKIQFGCIILYLFISITLNAQTAKTELENAFSDQDITIDRLIFQIAKYVEIETNYIIQNEDIILNKLGNSSSYAHKIDVYNLMANAYWYRNKKDKYIYYSNKVDSILKIYNDYNVGLSTHLRLIALHNNDQDKDIKISLSLLDSALHLSQEADNIYLTAKAFYSIAFVYWDNSDHSNAMIYFQKAEKLYHEIKAKYALARIYNYYAIYNRLIGDMVHTLDYYLKIDSIYTSMDEKGRKAINLGKIANIYSDMGNYDDALKMLNSSLEIYKSLDMQSRMPGVYEKIGSVFLKKNNYASAKEYFLKSIELESKSGNQVRIIGLKLNMIDIYIDEKKYDSALSTLQEALKIYQDLGFISGIASTYQKFSEIFYLQKNYSKAIENIQHTIKLSKEVNNKFLLTEAYKQLSTYYEAQNNDRDALTYFKLHKNLSDSLFNEEVVLKLENLKAKYELSQKEQEIQQLETKAEIKKKQYQLTVVISVLIIVLMILFFNYKRSIDKSRHLNILANKNKQLEETSKKLEDSNRFKGRLISNISHEIRTPLNIILGLTNVIQEKTQPEQLKQSADDIQRSSENLTRMIDSMLEISLLEAEQIEVKFNKFNSLELKRYIEEIIIHELWKKSKKLDYKVDSFKNFDIYSDKGKIFQIIHEIIDNSIKYTDSGSIEVFISDSNNALNVTIKDTGIGMESNNINFIFDRFYKIENNDKFYRGAGLGLAICQELVELLNGNIIVKSEINKGSSFHVNIPMQKV